jgi:hypothetical protein
MSWLVTAKQYIPAVIGEEFGGGYFAGYISHTADGNPTHALIVAPRGGVEPGATGTGYTLTTNLAWKTAATTTSGTTSSFDGVANTAAMVSAGIADHPAAEFCVNLTIGGYTDWYLPSRSELDIAYFNLKPTTDANNTSTSLATNVYQVPPRTAAYTISYPAQTYVTAFNTSAQQFEATILPHWTSTEVSSTNVWRFIFTTGNLGSAGSPKTSTTLLTRAFRRIAL